MPGQHPQQDDPSQVAYLPWTGNAAGRGEIRAVGRLGGATYSVAIAGDRVYAGIEERLAVFDVGDPLNVVLLGYAQSPGGLLTDLLVAGDTLYALTSGPYVHAFDIANRDEPHLRSTVTVRGAVREITAVGGQVYAAVSDAGGGSCLHVVADDGRELTVVGTLQASSGACAAVSVAGSTAYVSAESGALHVVDVADPEAPNLVRTISTGARVVSGSALHGDFLYIAHGFGVQVIDLSDPGAPYDVASVPLRGAIDDMAFAVDHLYLADPAVGFHVVDVSDPRRPTVDGDLVRDGGLHTVAAASTMLAAAGPRGNLVLYDIGTPASPSELGSYQGFSHAVTVAGGRDRAYVVTNGPQGLSIVVDNGVDPFAQVGFHPLTKASWLTDDEVRLADKHPYVMMQYYGWLLSIDVKAPTAPDPRRLLALDGAVDMAVNGNQLYSAGDVLRVVDLTRPADPEQVFFRRFSDSYAEAGTATAVAADGDRLYVAIRSVKPGRVTNLWVFETADPLAPRQIGVFTNIGPVVSMASRAGYVWVSGGTPGTYGVRTIDARDAGAVHLIGTSASKSFGGRARHLDLEGDRLAVVEEQYFDEGVYQTLGLNAVHIMDVSRPDQLISRDALEFESPLGGIDLLGERLYIAARDQGLLAVDLSGLP
jgi:hypothetical protein